MCSGDAPVAASTGFGIDETGSRAIGQVGYDRPLRPTML